MLINITGKLKSFDGAPIEGLEFGSDLNLQLNSAANPVDVSPSSQIGAFPFGGFGSYTLGGLSQTDIPLAFSVIDQPNIDFVGAGATDRKGQLVIGFDNLFNGVSFLDSDNYEAAIQAVVQNFASLNSVFSYATENGTAFGQITNVSVLANNETPTQNVPEPSTGLLVAGTAVAAVVTKVVKDKFFPSVAPAPQI